MPLALRRSYSGVPRGEVYVIVSSLGALTYSSDSFVWFTQHPLLWCACCCLVSCTLLPLAYQTALCRSAPCSLLDMNLASVCLTSVV